MMRTERQAADGAHRTDWAQRIHIHTNSQKNISRCDPLRVRAKWSASAALP